MIVENQSHTQRAIDIAAAVPLGTPSSVLVTEVDLTASLEAADWYTGPLPILQPGNTTTDRRGHSWATDADARRTLVANQQAAALYGGAGLHRFHRFAPRAAQGTPTLLAVELLTGIVNPWTGRETGFVAAHIATPPGEADSDPFQSHLRALSAAVAQGPQLSSPLWSMVQGLLPDGVDLRTGAAVRTVSFHALDTAASTDLSSDALPAAYLLVTATPPDRAVDMARRARRHELTIRRNDWSVLVLRDGASVIAHQVSEEPFAETLRVHTHSLYLDALLLALVQRRLVDASGDRAASVSLDDPGALVDLEKAHFDFKRRYWRTSLTTKRTSPLDEVLRAFQEELLTTFDVADVEERVHAGAQLARSMHAESQDKAQRRLNWTVQNASVVIGALGLSFTAAPVISEPGPRLFLVAALIGVASMALAFLTLQITGRRTRLE